MKFFDKVKAFFASAFNKAGVVALLASTAYAALTEATAHTLNVPVLVVGFASGLVAIFWPDNLAAKSDVSKMIEDAFVAYETKNAAAISTLVSDTVKVAGDFVPTAQVATVQVATVAAAK